jgi:hypothetical protein
MCFDSRLGEWCEGCALSEKSSTKGKLGSLRTPNAFRVT